MNPEINTEVENVLILVSGLENQSHEQSGVCYKISDATTNVSGLTYTVLNYWNDLQGCGYGVIFNYISGTGSYEMSKDIGFLDPDIIINGYHPVAEFDWRQKVERVPIA
jgi:hypothetical protein